MAELTRNVTKTALAQGAGAAVSAGFAGLMTAVGFPQALVATPLVRGAVIGMMNTCYDDLVHRHLSLMESRKVATVNEVALSTFFDLAERDGATALSLRIEEDQLRYAFEASEALIMTSIRQAEQAKVELLGRYYGAQFYRGNIDWQDMHQMITMAGTLSLRQIVMIRLIAEDFKSLDNQLFISNPSACVEINRLLDYGIWQTEGASFSTNTSWRIQLRAIIPTLYSEQVCKELMLDRLSNDDIKRTVDSLRLTAEGEPERLLTQEDYDRHMQWQEFDDRGNIVIDGGSLDDDAGQYLYDLARGK